MINVKVCLLMTSPVASPAGLQLNKILVKRISVDPSDLSNMEFLFPSDNPPMLVDSSNRDQAPSVLYIPPLAFRLI